MQAFEPAVHVLDRSGWPQEQTYVAPLGPVGRRFKSSRPDHFLPWGDRRRREGLAFHRAIAFDDNHIVRLPRSANDRSYSAQLLTRYFVL